MKRPLLCLALALPGAALAHGSIQGVDHFSGGLLHPLVEPTHLLSIVALGLLVGQRGIARGEAALFCFAAGVAAGLIAAAFAPSLDGDVPLLAIALLAGLVVALALPLPGAALAAIAGVIGAGVGIGSNPEALSGPPLAAALAGAGIGATLWLLAVAAIVNTLHKPWLRVLVRVIASWASASSILVLALWLSQGPLAAPGARVTAGAVAHLDTTR